VLVSDFGLAHTRDAMPGDRSVAGTPRYLAPELRRGVCASARSDQYSFCLTVMEALGLAKDTVSARTHRALRQGLSEDPQSRFVDMNALLAALRPSQSRILSQVLGIAALLGVLIAGATGYRLALRDQHRRCVAELDRKFLLFDRATKARVHRGFLRTTTPYAQQAFEYAARLLEQHTAALHRASEQSCELGLSAGIAGDGARARSECLSRTAAELQALVRVLEAPESVVVERATQAVLSLRSPLDCLQLAPDPALRAATSHPLRDALAHVQALTSTGQWESAEREVRQLVTTAQQQQDRAVEAESLYLLGRLQIERSEFSASASSLRRSALAAEGSREQQVAAKAWIGLAGLTGEVLGDAARGREYEELAQVAVERLGGSDVSLIGDLALLRARLAHRSGDLATAEQQAKRALDILTASKGVELAESSETARLYGLLLLKRGQADRARQQLARFESALQRIHGSEHPRYARGLLTMATLLHEVGQHAESEKRNRQAIHILERTQPSSSPVLADAVMNLAVSVQDQGRFEEALGIMQRALTLMQQVPQQPRDDGVRLVMINLCDLQAHLGLDDAALASCQRAVMLFEQAGEGMHPELAEALRVMGVIHLRRKQVVEAQSVLQRALDLAAHGGLWQANRAAVRFALAQALWGQKKHAEAVAMAKQARTELRDASGSADTLAQMDAWLSQRAGER
jgi:tetratricopeptide (TPR) repeat protein